MSDWYDIHGNIVTDPKEMGRHGADWESVRRETKTDAGTVSTVHLGLNHSWGGGPPLIFETMVFGGNLDQECKRYSTIAEAHAGHAEMVGRVLAEAQGFVEIASQPILKTAVETVERALAAHRKTYGIDDYVDLYAALVRAVQR